MITVKNLGFEYGNREVFSGVSFTAQEAEKVGIVGPNGSGKSTLLRVISGELQPSTGQVIAPGVEIGYMPQQLDDWVEYRVDEFLKKVTGYADAYAELDETSKKLGNDYSDQTMLLYQNALERVEKLGGDFETRVEGALRRAGIADIDIETLVGELSGGQRTKLAMAATFATSQDVVLLDEPTNNLDSQGIVVLERFIREAKTSFIIVSHDRRFLRHSVTKIIELLGGDEGVQTYGMGYEEYVEAREAAREAAFRRYEEHQNEVRRLRGMATTAIQEVNGGRVRRTDNDKLGANYRGARAGSAQAAKVRRANARLEQLQDDRPEQPKERPTVDLRIGKGETAGEFSTAIAAQDLVLAYPGSKEQFGPYNINVTKGERVLVSGPNGSGKTTLLKALFNPELIVSGNVSLAKNCKVGYMDQNHTLPNMSANPIENIMLLQPDIERSTATNLLVKFNVDRETFAMPVERMSPGERAKVLMAAITYGEPDLLILDEPTNHLDIPAIEGIEDALKSYPGTMMIVTHDREFVDTVGVDREYRIK